MTNLEKLIKALKWQGGTHTQVNAELLRLGYLGYSGDFLACSDTVVEYICNSIERYDAGLMFNNCAVCGDNHAANGINFTCNGKGRS